MSRICVRIIGISYISVPAELPSHSRTVSLRLTRCLRSLREHFGVEVENNGVADSPPSLYTLRIWHIGTIILYYISIYYILRILYCSVCKPARSRRRIFITATCSFTIASMWVISSSIRDVGCVCTRYSIVSPLVHNRIKYV